MNKIIRLLLVSFLFLPILSMGNVSQAQAQNVRTCTGVTYSPAPNANGFDVSVNIDPSSVVTGSKYLLRWYGVGPFPNRTTWTSGQDMRISGSTASHTFPQANAGWSYNIMVVYQDTSNRQQDYCQIENINIAAAAPNDPTGARCNSNVLTIADTKVFSPTTISVNEAGMINFGPSGDFRFSINGRPWCTETIGIIQSCVNRPYTFTQARNALTVTGLGGETYCAMEINVPEDEIGPVTIGVDDNPATASQVPYRICEQIPDGTQRGICERCLGNNQDAEPDGIWTALGCIKADPQSIISSIMQIGLSLAGGVALIMILAAAFLFSTSQGDPKRTSDAKDLLTSAVIGLLFVIFSVTILQFIGVSILRIPDFAV